MPVGARFSAPVQTGSGVDPASCTMRTGSFPRVKQQGRSVDNPAPSSAEVKERVKIYLYSSYGCSRVYFTFTFIDKAGITLIMIIHFGYFTLFGGIYYTKMDCTGTFREPGVA
jgi:hypothetical protein